MSTDFQKNMMTHICMTHLLQIVQQRDTIMHCEINVLCIITKSVVSQKSLHNETMILYNPKEMSTVNLCAYTLSTQLCSKALLKVFGLLNRL